MESESILGNGIEVIRSREPIKLEDLSEWLKGKYLRLDDYLKHVLGVMKVGEVREISTHVFVKGGVLFVAHSPTEDKIVFRFVKKDPNEII